MASEILFSPIVLQLVLTDAYTENIKKKMYNEKQRNEGVTIMFNATFNNISVISSRSVLLVVETGVP